MYNAHTRLKNIKNQYDVAVVGGGIYGAATAWEASSRGLSVVLLDRGDFGSGTSANSLKTIHGGLRALQRLDLKEMREYIRERRALMRIAPHLVMPMPCVMPTYRPLFKSKLFIGVGLKFYDFIAFDRNKELDESHIIPSSTIITREHLDRLAPNLDRSAATGGACWIDAQAYNSERLTLSFVMSAINAGADIFNYLDKTAYLTEHGRISGVTARDVLTGEMLNFKVNAVIDCTGPWAGQDNQFSENTKNKGPEVMARAVNLVIRRRLSDCALGIGVRTDGCKSERLLFVAPWRTGNIVGTWYYQETELPDKPTISESEISDCIFQINSAFPSFKLDLNDVSLVHVGMQPAHQGKGSISEPEVWRHTRILYPGARSGQEGLYWVQGVKLTTARATAVEVVGRVAHYLNREITASKTHRTRLYGADFRDYQEYRKNCITRLADRYPEQVILRLLANYGSNTDLIMDLVDHDQSLAEYIPGTTDTIKAELHYVLNNEMPLTLSDLVMRRTDLGSFACPSRDTLDFCTDLMAGYFGWHEKERQENLNDLLQCYPMHKHDS
jgi:glycerol-3-phosphate dehydrogenase